jgi:uncharacterized LabA/DUF88 family protein
MGSNFRERLSVFIDGPSLQRSAKSLRLDIDYKRLLMMFQQRGYLARAHYYAALSPDRADCTQRPLLDWLCYNGFTVVSKIVADYAATGGHGALAVEIAVDAMQLADGIDHFVLFSNSADLTRLIEALQQKGRQVTVVSTLRGEPIVADELRRQADQFLELEELRAILSREPRAAANGAGSAHGIA